MVQDLYILMITAAVVSILFKLLKQPVVLGYIVAGVLVGPNLFGETFVNGANVKAWGDIGVLFVLFCIGLEFRLKNLISSGKDQHPHRGGCGGCGTDGIAVQYCHPPSVRGCRVGGQGRRFGHYARGMVRLRNTDYTDADTHD